MPKSRISFKQALDLEETILKASVERIGTSIDHPAEKGRAVEKQVARLIEDFLPREYGIGTGFIAYHDNTCIRVEKTIDKAVLQYFPTRDRIRMSTQVDIIIYDSLRSGPIIRLDSSDVFPLEAVLAYVEVKKTLHSFPDKKGRTDILKCIRQAHDLRSMQTRFYLASIEGTYTGVLPVAIHDALSIRSYVFALGADKELSDPELLRTSLESCIKSEDSFLTGMYVHGVGYFESHPAESSADPNKGRVYFHPPDQALLRFKTSLFTGLSRFHRVDKGWAVAIDSYFNGKPFHPQQFFTTGPFRA